MSTISVKDGSGNPVTVNILPATGQSNLAGSLPVGHATDDPIVLAMGATGDAATLSTNIGLLKAIKGLLSGSLSVTGTFFQATQPVSAAALPLPAGAATETGNLAQILTKLGAVVLAAGTAVIGKVGLQVGGADVATANPLPIAPTAYANLATAQVSVATGATLIAAARTGRSSITVENSGTTPIFLGGSGVLTTTGLLLPGVLGASVTLNTAAAIYGIVASGSQTVTLAETY